MMEEASRALVARDYFGCERLGANALDRAFGLLDYDRMARVLLPLEEARRQKRDLAFDTRRVIVVGDQLPSTRSLVAGCYLICPPLVGVDGRNLRESADRRRVPAIVIVREPTTREGLWPLVAVGPVTIRAKVAPPAAPLPPRPRAPRRRAKAPSPPESRRAGSAPPGEPVPSPEWFLAANEALGDAALAEVNPAAHPETRIEALMLRLAAHPDHEKLHQALADACRAAVRDPFTGRRRRVVKARQPT